MFVETKREGEVVAPVEPWRKALLDAAQYIRDHGWCQNELRNLSGNVCMVGSILFSNLQQCRNEIDPAKSRVMAHLGNSSISRWNDTPGRTKEEVIAVMETVARS